MEVSGLILFNFLVPPRGGRGNKKKKKNMSNSKACHEKMSFSTNV